MTLHILVVVQQNEQMKCGDFCVCFASFLGFETVERT